MVDIYEINENTWSIAYLSLARADLAATSVGSKALFGGGASSIDYSAVVDVYDANTGTWSILSLSVGRDYLAATTVGSKALFGGGNEYGADYGFEGLGYSAVVDVPCALGFADLNLVCVGCYRGLGVLEHSNVRIALLDTINRVQINQLVFNVQLVRSLPDDFPSGGSYSVLSLGSYSAAAGRSTCQACNPGTYAHLGYPCSNCSVGYYQPSASQSACLQCAAGSIFSFSFPNGGSYNNNRVHIIIIGSYSAAPRQSTCQVCYPGKYAQLGYPMFQLPYWLLSTKCKQFHMCTVRTRFFFFKTSQSFHASVIGTYAAATGQAVCTSCDAGSYCPSIGLSFCSICVATTYSVSGQSVCTTCEIGRYSQTPGLSTCLVCAPGAYQNLSGQAFFELCQPGSYQSSAGASACLSCPNGSISGTGATCCICLSTGQQPVAESCATSTSTATTALATTTGTTTETIIDNADAGSVVVYVLAGVVIGLAAIGSVVSYFVSPAEKRALIRHACLISAGFAAVDLFADCVYCLYLQTQNETAALGSFTAFWLLTVGINIYIVIQLFRGV